jgi:hypothetical protein
LVRLNMLFKKISSISNIFVSVSVECETNLT